MIRSARAATAAAMVLSLAAVPAAGQTAATTSFGGEVRPRWENRTEGIGPHVSMRTRAHLAHARDEGQIFIQIQDVRLWGEELSTSGDFSADALDVHQAWVTIGAEETWVRVGRQEVVLGEERLVGAVNWAQQGRSFDGVRMRVPMWSVAFELLGAQLAEDAASSFGEDRHLGGGYATWSGAATDRPHPLHVEGYVLADGGETWRWTSGGRLLGKTAGFVWRGEATLQRGVLPSAGVRAWMVGASVMRPVGPVAVTLWYDRLSGDNDPLDGVVRVFDTLFATNHRYYGHADIFTDIPLHTGGRGLQDVAVIVGGTVRRTILEVAAHRFDAAADDGLPSSRYGEEVDVTLGRSLGDGLRLGAGLSWVSTGSALEAVRGFEGELWTGYLYLDANF